jgi:phage terminase large subunit GpA-like protein
MRSYRILSTRVETWEDVETIMFNTPYPLEDYPEITFPVIMVNFDTGGGINRENESRTEEVYDFCRRWPDRARPIKGAQRLNGQPFRVSSIDRMPRTGQLIPGGLKLWTIDTSFYKDKIQRLIRNTALDSPSGFYLHKDPPAEYLQQMCSERKEIQRDKKGRVWEEWVPVRRKAPNHFLDCEVYVMALADMFHVFSMPKDGSWRRVYANMPEDAKPENVEKSPWISKKSNWIKRNG